MTRKIVGYYVVLAGQQIAWFSSRTTATQHARKHGGTVQPEYA